MDTFSCIGCVKKGSERIAYILKNSKSKDTVKVNKFTMAVLVGRNQISNAKGDIYKDIVIYRGIGCDFSKLPALKLNEDGTKKTKEQLVSEATERKQKRVQRINEINEKKNGRPSNEQIKVNYIEKGKALIKPKYMKTWEETVEKNYATVDGRELLNTALECLKMLNNGMSDLDVIKKAKNVAHNRKISIDSCNNALTVVSKVYIDKNKSFYNAGLI